jgi:hypothetical protein
MTAHGGDRLAGFEDQERVFHGGVGRRCGGIVLMSMRAENHRARRYTSALCTHAN